MGKNYRHFVPVPNVFNLKSVDWKLFSYHEIRVGQIRATRPKNPCRTYLAPHTQFGAYVLGCQISWKYSKTHLH